ncbi:Protein RALF-like 34 [Morella rubra]|uniref:Protein RALF-like 34 n=1 Tax=Morella rubra TaxID=262757 RepID=A0A6A1W4R0_9ROSI|nr:Protein RALF-like 34 [Morella rubra]
MSLFLADQDSKGVSSMAFPFLKVLLVLFMIVSIEAQVDHTTFRLRSTDALEWPWTLSFQSEFSREEGQDGSVLDRRFLWGEAMHYYISYGALSANRVPCPPRSGRSYYTHNCFGARGPVRPYTRGCSTITHCRR